MPRVTRPRNAVAKNGAGCAKAAYVPVAVRRKAETLDRLAGGVGCDPVSAGALLESASVADTAERRETLDRILREVATFGRTW